MNVFKFKTINNAYVKLVKRIYEKPDYFEEVISDGKGPNINKRSRFHLRNVHLMIKNPEKFDGYKVKCPERSKKMNNYIMRETALFDCGETRAEVMGNISTMWRAIKNPDGTINANYGYMVYYLRDAPKDISQWEWCKNRLDKNIHTLQAYMHFNRPKDQFVENLDQPCTVFTQFTVEHGYLNFHSYMRSNDIIYGTPYNIAYFRLLQERMLHYLNSQGHNLKFGYLHHNTTSLHLYVDKMDIARSIFW